METFLFNDTETTGFKKSGSLMQQGQGRVCQMALILTDNQGKTLSEFATLIKPDDWSIHPEAGKVHGWSDDDCRIHGINHKTAFEIFENFSSRASQIVAHNESFDRGMMEVEKAYATGDQTSIPPWFCTMKTNTHISGGKWPKLEAALQHYCNKSLGNKAHDAMEDARACRDIFFAMRGVCL